MLTKVEVRTPLGLLLTLELDDVSDGLALEDIQGLEPVKATLVSSGFASLPGAFFQNSKRETRNLIFVIGLVPDYITTSVQDLRARLYDFFMTETQVSLRFYTDEGLTVDISGRVESCTSPIFVKEPTMNVSIICFDPDFSALSPVEFDGDTVSDSTESLITYNGTIPTGIIFELDVDRTVTQFTIYHRTPDGVTKTMDFAASLVADDVVTISTIFGSKSVTLLRGGIQSSLLYGLSPQSPYIQLVKGDNYIRVHATGAAIPYKITYTPKYGGL